MTAVLTIAAAASRATRAASTRGIAGAKARQRGPEYVLPLAQRSCVGRGVVPGASDFIGEPQGEQVVRKLDVWKDGRGAGAARAG
jgi:hypothetical protein